MSHIDWLKVDSALVMPRSLLDRLCCFFMIASLILTANFRAVMLCLRCYAVVEHASVLTQNTTLPESGSKVVKAHGEGFDGSF